MTKEETKKLTRETRRDIVNIVMVVISCILYCLLIYGMVLMFRQFSTMVSSMNDYISCVDDAADVSDASAFLTDQVHHYVVEREPGHLEAYFVEANETKRRESALENLEEFADKETISSMQKALDYSNELMKTEIYAMRLIVESRGEDVSEFPQEVQDVRLLEEDQKLSSEEKAGKAVSLVFNEEYHQARENIEAGIDEFLDTVIGTTRQKQQKSITNMGYIMIGQSVLFGVLIVQSIITITLIIINNKKKRKEDGLFINQIIHAFAKSIDIKDKYTNGHSIRVAMYAKMIAKKAGFPEKAAEAVYNIGLLHDIGKITVPDEILNKNGRLDDEEFIVIKKHTSNGSEILKEIAIAPELAIGAQYHHERIDGGGYPQGKTGDEIPEIAQIIAVADTFDAMFSTRPYRKKMPLDKVVAELKRCAGTQLSVEYVSVLLQLIQEGAIVEKEAVSAMV
ncbi:MAG: HD-GYP domain-containing protein [Dorea sp.]|nr:HD-GYP domain-containing protein [Dorea sp.]